MRPRKMTARKAGTCRQCGEPVLPGQMIFWARGQGAWHCDCQTANLTADQCTACKGSGMRWNNAPCPMCDGTGSRKVQDFAKAGGHDNSGPEDRCCGDLAYEDACARACEL